MQKKNFTIFVLFVYLFANVALFTACESKEEKMYKQKVLDVFNLIYNMQKVSSACKDIDKRLDVTEMATSSMARFNAKYETCKTLDDLLILEREIKQEQEKLKSYCR